MTALLRSGLIIPLVLVVALALPSWAVAQGPAPVAGPGRPPVARNVAAAAEVGLRWNELTPAQQAALTPLQREWPGIDAPNKQKWVEVSRQFPKLAPQERARIQARMGDWARLTPVERGRARLNFEEAKQVPAQDRQARWKDYQALDPEQKRQLAARAASAPEVGRRAAQASTRAERTRDGPQPKSNIVPNPAFAATPKQVTPTVLQAQPGATTTLISKRPTPPAHQQTGMPKIAATPGFVDKTTLLPRRGPQAAAARPARPPGAEPPR